MSQERASSWFMKKEFGFNGVPPAEAQEPLIQAVMICARGDGELSAAERDWALGLAAVSNLSEQVIDRLASYPATDSVASVIAAHPMVDRSGRRAAVYFAVCAAKSDGALAAGEIETIKSLAEQIAVPEEVVDQIMTLVELEERVNDLRMALLAPGGRPF